VASLSDGVAAEVIATYALQAANAVPILSQINSLAGASENLEFTISFADLQGAADEADPGASVEAFEVSSVDTSLGTLTINGSAWHPTSNNRIEAGQDAVWTPAATINGSGNAAISAFTVLAVDDRGVSSAAAVPVRIEVEAIKDAPILNVGNYSFSGVNEDTTTPPACRGCAPGDRGGWGSHRC